MPTPVNSHLDNISITIILAALAVQAAGFSVVMLVVDQATNTLDGDRVRSYAGPTDADADFTAGFISATTQATIKTGFSQNPSPALIKVGRIDTVGGETYSTGYTAIKNFDDGFYGVVIDVRTSTEQLLIAGDVESENRMFVMQSSDADWRTTGLPAAYATLAGKERTSVVYHDNNLTQEDMAAACRWLAFDPDLISAVFEGPLKAVLALTVAPTTAEKAFLDANFANHALPYGGELFYLDAGVNIAGRPMYEILTADWFEQRLQERIARLRVAKSTRGEKIPVTPEGQALVIAELDGQLSAGVTAGHFVAGQTVSVAVPITQQDRDDGKLRFTAQAQDAANARLFDFTINFSRQPISA